MATVEGLNLRGSRYYLRVLIPEDLQAHYGKPRVNPSLRTSDKAEAVRKGLRLRAEWLEEFETKRKAINPQALEVITLELMQALAERARRSVLKGDQHRREGNDPLFNGLSQASRSRLPYMRNSDGSLSLPERDPLDGLTGIEADTLAMVNIRMNQETAQDLARMNLRSVLPLLQADAQAMGFTITRETEGLTEALKAYLRSYRLAWQDASRMDAGEVLSTDSHLPITQTTATPTGLPEALLLPTAPAVTAAGNGLTSLRDIFGKWLEAEPRSKDTEQAVSRALRAAEECLGSPLYVQQVSRAQGNTFKAWLQHPDC